jgi:glyoxylase-like metal-dependent hydrolase (beta-lactamase superfamily II)
MNAPLYNAIDYTFADTIPAPGKAMEVLPGVFWLRMPLPFALNHINLWLLKDGDGWAIVDTGFGHDETKIYWEQIFSSVLAGQNITRVIVTHYHPDHIGSAAWLCERWNVDLWITMAEYLSAHAIRNNSSGFEPAAAQALFRAHGLTDAQLKAQDTRGNAYARGVPALPATYTRIIDGDVIRIGEHDWRIKTAFGHAPEHATLYCDELKVLISGDQVLPRITTNVGVWGNMPDADPLELFLRSLDFFEPLPPDTLVLPSHDRVFRGLHFRLQQLREHHVARLDELVEALDKPKTAAELLPVLFKRALDDHQLMFAIGETVAHLNYLLQKKRVNRTRNADGKYYFAASSISA